MEHKPTKEQARIYHFVVNRPENLLIEARAGAGKCLGINTPVLMYDGTIKFVQNIKIGDLLMGDDSKPRKVLNTNIGFGDLYKIIPTKGNEWICNDVHVMTIHHEKMKKIIDISLNKINYPKYSNGNYRYARLIRTSVEFSENKTNIDPYLLGLWLGDGSKEEGSPIIHVHKLETPILKYLSKIKYDNIVPKFNEYQKNLFSISLTGKKGKNNILRNEFKKCLNSDGSFSIPKNYLINSKENREKLLAGIIDTDGHIHHKYCEIITKYKSFSDDLLFLSRSLGFAAYSKEKIGTIKSINFTGKYWRILISGSFENIPCLLERKKCLPRQQIKSVLRTGFKKEYIGESNYYGFTLDGNGRFLLGDFTITHNTTVLVEILKLLPKDKDITFLAFNKHIQEELKDRIPEYVRSYTSHGLGLSAIKRKYGKNIEFDEFKADHIIQKKAKSWKLEEDFDDEDTKNAYLSNMKKLINLLKLSMTIDSNYYSYIAERYDIPFDENRDKKRVSLVMEAMMNDKQTYDFTDMVFLPAIDKNIWLFPQDYVLVDEAQDMNMAQQKLVEKMLRKDKFGKIIGRLIAVGDCFQCQPAGTKILMYDGSEKNIEDIQIGDGVVSYDKSQKGCFMGFYKNHRWGAESMKSHAPIVEEINKRFITDSLVIIESNNKKTKYTYNHRCFVRFRKDKIKAHVLYLMEKNGNYRIGITPLWSKFNDNSVTLRAKQEKADKFWILNIYETKREAYLEEQYNSLIYGIPQLRFNDNKTGLFTQKTIDEFYNRFDKVRMEGSAISILDKFDRLLGFPLWEKGKKNYLSKEHLFETKACNIIKDYMEMIIFDENNIHERTHGNRKLSDKIIKPKYCNIDNLYHEHLNGYVYSLKIKKWETYIADGILTHNSIYGFTGVHERTFQWFRDFQNMKALPLDTTFRCAKNIVLEANRLVPDIKPLDSAPDGIVREGSILNEAESGDFILCRTTMPLVKLFFHFLLKKKKAVIKGSDIGLSLIEMIGDIKTMDKLKDHWNKELEKFRSDLRRKGILDFNEHSGYVAISDKANTLLFLTRIATSIPDLKQKIGEIFTDEITGIVLSTVHKSKGLEANRVFIARPDLLPMRVRKAWQVAQERNLEYVAITRARHELIYDREWSDEK